MKEYARPVAEVPVRCLSCYALGPDELRHGTAFPHFERDRQRMRPRLHTAAGAASCNLDGSRSAVLEMLEEFRVDIAGKEVGMAKNLPMQRDRALHSLQDEHVQCAIHTPDRLITCRSVHDQLCD